MDQEIARHIQAFRLMNREIIDSAVMALANIGVPAVPALCEALKDSNSDIRIGAAKALGKIRTPSTIAALSTALKDSDSLVRVNAAYGLGQMGAESAIPALCEALNDEDGYVRYNASDALRRMGAFYFLPREVLAQPSMTGEQCFRKLESLRQLLSPTLENPLQEIRPYCEQHLLDPEQAVRDGAKAVLDFLDEQNLLRLAERDETTEQEHLLHGAIPAVTEVPAEEHLKFSEASSSPEPERKRGWWFLRRKG